MPEALAAHDYYRATSQGESHAPLAGPCDAAVCIVGALFAGLAAAQMTYWYDELRDWMRQ